MSSEENKPLMRKWSGRFIVGAKLIPLIRPEVSFHIEYLDDVGIHGRWEPASFGVDRDKTFTWSDVDRHASEPDGGWKIIYDPIGQLIEAVT